MNSDYLLRNRMAWNRFAEDFVSSGHEDWSAEEPTWGIWGIPESQVHMLDDVDGSDAIELGCGTAYVSAWLARRGARPVGIDNSPKQPETARRFQAEFSVRFPLIQGDAERTPLADATFDLAISEYGAAIWCDPYVWIPEAARLLRPGCRLVFLGHSPLAMMCSPFDDDVIPIEDRLIRDHFDMHRFDWADATEFQISHSETIRLLHSCGFQIEELLERATAGRVDHRGPVGHLRVGAALARRGSLEGAEASLSQLGGSEMLPSSASGKPGLCATSQGWPSGSTNTPA